MGPLDVGGLSVNEKVENIILAQLREMREEMSSNYAKIEERLGSVEAKVDGTTAVLIGLGKYIHDIDARVEHIEEKLGIET